MGRWAGWAGYHGGGGGIPWGGGVGARDPRAYIHHIPPAIALRLLSCSHRVAGSSCPPSSIHICKLFPATAWIVLSKNHLSQDCPVSTSRKPHANLTSGRRDGTGLCDRSPEHPRSLPLQLCREFGCLRQPRGGAWELARSIKLQICKKLEKLALTGIGGRALLTSKSTQKGWASELVDNTGARLLKSEDCKEKPRKAMELLLRVALTLVERVPGLQGLSSGISLEKKEALHPSVEDKLLCSRPWSYHVHKVEGRRVSNHIGIYSTF